MNFLGIKVFTSPSLVARGEQFRFPIHRKKRALKKWAKRDENYRLVPQCYRVGESVYCHPSIAGKLKLEIKACNDARSKLLSFA